MVPKQTQPGATVVKGRFGDFFCLDAKPAKSGDTDGDVKGCNDKDRIKHHWLQIQNES